MNDKMPDKFTMQHIRDAIAQLKRRDKNDSEMQKQIEELGLTPREILLNKHTCHIKGCTLVVAPKYLMCYAHWQKVPKRLQSQVYKYYRVGQEIDKNPSEEYLIAAKDAINYVDFIEYEEKLKVK